MPLIESHGVRILRLDDDGPAVSDANDIIGDAWAERAELIVVPVSRLVPEFLDLSSRVAGEFTQKLVNYRLRLVLLGDISERTAASDALAAYVWESNRGNQVQFASDEAELESFLDRIGTA